jgi:TAT (twin-arginine translocation) pathway signal sequence
MLSRRNFLNSALGAGAGMALASQGPQPAAAQPAPRRMIGRAVLARVGWAA